MRKIAVMLVGVILVPAIFVGVASAQTYPPAQPAQPAPQKQPAPSPAQPAQPAQPTPAQAPAQPTQPSSGGQYPSVSNLKPFAAEANFMSLPGYLRYLVHQQASQWLTYAEASRIVSQQKGL